MSERARSDLALTAKIEAIHRRSKDTYGSPNIHAELADDHGIRVGRKRVAQLMRAAGLRGATLRRYVVTTQTDSGARPAVDLVDRQFYAEGPDRLWVSDITYIPTWSGFLYLAMVLDVYSRRVVGWAMETHLRTELILAALNMAITQRQPQAVIHHSDRGCQYTSYAFGKRCREAGVMPSMGSVGDAYDNAMAESFFASLERELLNRRRFKSQAEAKMAVFEWIEGWYNPHRRHSSLGYRSPVNYERGTRGEARRMTMTLNRSLQTFVGDTEARGRRRSPLVELYTQSIFGAGKKKSAQSFCRLRRQTAPGV